MTAAVMDSTAGLAGLAPEWAALWQRTPGAAPFQHPAWLLPWWARFGTARPRVATWRVDGRLCGILPAYVLDEGGGAKLLPMGAGTTDYCDALGEGVDGMVGALLRQCVAEGVGRADLIDVPAGSVLPEVPVPAGWRARWTPGNPCPVLALADIPGSIRRKVRMNRNRAGRAGGYAIEAAGLAGFPTLARLHEARWPGVADPAVLAKLEAALPGLDEAGLLRLAVLRIGGEAAAAILALVAPGRIYFYLSGYDPGQAFVSPGTILLAAMLDEALQEGRTEAHFLRGTEGYKYAWGAVDRVNRDGAFVWCDG